MNSTEPKDMMGHAEYAISQSRDAHQERNTRHGKKYIKLTIWFKFWAEGGAGCGCGGFPPAPPPGAPPVCAGTYEPPEGPAPAPCGAVPDISSLDED